MTTTGHRMWLKAAQAAAVLALALLVRAALIPLIGASLPYLSLYGALAFSLWRGGLGLALVTLFAGAACIEVGAPRLLDDVTSWQNQWPVRLVTLALISAGLLLLGNALLRLRQRLAQAQRTATDLAHQKEAGERDAAETLRRSEATLQAFYDSAPVCMGVVELTDDDDILHLHDNPLSCEIFGLPPGGTAGRLASSLGASPDTIRIWLRHYRQSLQTGPVQFEYALPVAGGALRWMTATVSPLGQGPSGRWRFSYVSEDITAQHTLHAALAEREAHARLALDVARLGTWRLDLPGQLADADVRAREICGLPSQGPLRLDEFVQRIHPDDRSRLQRAIKAAFDADQGPSYAEEFRVVHTDGAVRWIASRAQLLAGTADPPLLVGTVLDITERREAEQQLRDADRKKDEFLAILAHELRNPLSPLVSGVQVLRRQGADADTRERALSIMDRQLSHMVRLVDDLLDVSRISRGRLELSLSVLRVRDVVDHALEVSAPLLRHAEHDLVLDVDDTLHVHADLTRLSQVFANLLNNAAKYTPRGGRIELRAHGKDGRVQVTVTDNGVGIAERALPKVFDLFAQIDDSPQQPGLAAAGLGIGLSIARRLVEMHGGTLTVSSPGEGYGSTFTVTLPLARPMAAPTPVPPMPEGRPLRLLIADDNEDVALSLAEMLSLDGHDVRVVHDGLQAVETARTTPLDAILLDIGMPGMNGHEAASAIRALRLPREPLLVAVSGWGQESDRARSSRAGFDAHLVKPVRADDLAALLRSKVAA